MVFLLYPAPPLFSAQACHLCNLILCKCALLIRSSAYIHSFIPWIFNDKLLKRSEPSLFCSLLYVELQEQYLTVSHSSWMNEWANWVSGHHTDWLACMAHSHCDSTILLGSLTSIMNIHVPEQCLILFNLQVPFLAPLVGLQPALNPPKTTFITLHS